MPKIKADGGRSVTDQIADGNLKILLTEFAEIRSFKKQRDKEVVTKFLLHVQERCEFVTGSSDLVSLPIYLMARSSENNDLYDSFSAFLYEAILDHPLRLFSRHDHDMFFAAYRGLKGRFLEQAEEATPTTKKPSKNKPRKR